jgi:hypothetical protein
LPSVDKCDCEAAGSFGFIPRHLFLLTRILEASISPCCLRGYQPMKRYVVMSRLA